jgi:hypothetical protein
VSPEARRGVCSRGSTEEAAMYVRVAAFENPDMSQVDELKATIEERARTGTDIPDAKRILLLLDREGRRSLGITFFETEDAIRRAEPVFERMGDEIPEEKRGKRTSVDVYEVAIEEIAEGARAARVSSLEGSADRIDEGIAFIKEQILPFATDMTGWRGVVALVDRASGRTKTITLWDSPETLRASDERANELRTQAAEAMDETIVGVDRYEVALSMALAPSPA